MASKEPLITPASGVDYPQAVFSANERADTISPPKLRLNTLQNESQYIVQPSINSPMVAPLPHTRLHRLVHKDGSPGTIVNVFKAQRGRAYAFDLYTTLIDCKWWLFIILIVLTYMISYFFFGVLWYCASLIPDSNEPNSTCVYGVNDILSAFFLSIEVQSTIGFGSRHPRSDAHCVPDFIILFGQSIIGLFIDAFYLALIVTKISRPYRRKATILFSKKASVFRDKDRWFFSFRISDMRKSKLVESHVKLYLFHLTRVEGGAVAHTCQNLDVGYDTGEDRLQMILPSEILHEISPASPLYRLSPRQLCEGDFELVVVLEGIVEGTGSTTQIMTSYKDTEIVFGFRFSSLLNSVHNKVLVDLTKFDILEMKENYPRDMSIGELENSQLPTEVDNN